MIALLAASKSHSPPQNTEYFCQDTLRMFQKD